MQSVPAPDIARLSSLLAQRGLGVADVARRAGLDRTTVWRLLNGKYRTVSLRTIRSLSLGLDIPPAALGLPGFDLEPWPQSKGSRYESVFLSYGGPDEDFARALDERLRTSGVETYFFPRSKIPGRRLHRTMSEGVASYDRVILICSEASLARLGVLNELEHVLAREAREGGGERLIPVTIDYYVYSRWNPSRRYLAEEVRSRVIADFSAWAVTRTILQSEFHRLLAGLELNSNI